MIVLVQDRCALMNIYITKNDAMPNLMFQVVCGTETLLLRAFGTATERWQASKMKLLRVAITSPERELNARVKRPVAWVKSDFLTTLGLYRAHQSTHI